MLLSSSSTQKFTTNIAKSSLLKQSFSNTLTCYYPLTRGIRDNPSVDEGKYHCEAQTKASYSAYEVNFMVPNELVCWEI